MRIFIEPPPDVKAEKKRKKAGNEKGRERGIWDLCMLLSGVSCLSTLGNCMQRDQHHQGDLGDPQRGLGEVGSCGLCRVEQ